MRRLSVRKLDIWGGAADLARDVGLDLIGVAHRVALAFEHLGAITPVGIAVTDLPRVAGARPFDRETPLPPRPGHQVGQAAKARPDDGRVTRRSGIAMMRES